MIKKLLGSTLFKSAGIYTLTNVINSAIPFLLLPVLTRYLSPFDYGVVATFQVLLGFVAPFTGLSINGAVARKYYEKDTVDLPVYIGNCLIILAISSGLVGIVLWLFAAPVSKLVAFPADWIWTVVAVSVAQFVGLISLSMWQVRVKPMAYGTFQISQTLLNIGLSLWFIISLKMNWQGRIWGQLIATLATGVIGLYLLRQSGWLKFKLNPDYIKSAIRFGVPLIPHAFGGWIMVATDRIIINNMIGVSQTGIYQVAYQLAAIIGLLETSFNAAWVPWFYSKLNENNYKTKVKIVKFTYLYVGGFLFLGAVLSVATPWILSFLVGKDFKGAGPYVVWLVMARAVEAMYFMTCNYVFYSTRTGYIAFATFTAALVHLVVTYYLVKLNGTIGAAQATVVSSLISVGLTWFFANRVYKMPWFFKLSSVSNG